jgi:hypothetical protein
MDKKTIEENDLKFREKLQDLRSNLAVRQKENRIKGKSGVLARLVLPLLLVVAVGYYWTGKTLRSHQPVSDGKSDTLAVTPLNPPGDRDHTVSDKILAEAETINTAQSPQDQDSGSPDDTAKPETPNPESKSETAAPSIETPVASTSEGEAMPTPRNLSDPEAFPPPEAAPPQARQASPSPNDSRKTTKAKPDRTKPSSAGLRSDHRPKIIRSLTCSEVSSRECVSPRSVFTIQTHRTPHFWMEVRSEAVPFVLKHVYYHEGQKYCEVPLRITHRRMRTWSNISLENPNHVGSWRVEIVAKDGMVLGRTAFNVTPGS